MRSKTAIRGAVRSVVVAAVIALVVAGCGGAKSSSSPAPASSASGLGSGVTALKAYLDQVKPIASQVSSTVDALPGAVKGLSKQPDSTWTTAAGKLDAVAAQLGDEATALAALSPPATLQPVQDAAVTGLQRTKGAVTKMAGALNKRVATSATRQAKILAKVGELQTQLTQLKDALAGGIRALVPGGSTPSP